MRCRFGQGHLFNLLQIERHCSPKHLCPGRGLIETLIRNNKQRSHLACLDSERPWLPCHHSWCHLTRRQVLRGAQRLPLERGLVALGSDVNLPVSILLMTGSKCGNPIHKELTILLFESERQKRRLPTRVAYCSELAMQSSALHLPRGRTETTRTTKAVKSRNLRSQQRAHAAGPGGAILGVGVGGGVYLILRMGALRMGHCLEPI